MRERGIDENVIASINLEEWSGIISDETENIRKAVKAIKSYEFIPEDVGVHGLLIDPYSGQLELVKAY
jgi:carbonic anhydrase